MILKLFLFKYIKELYFFILALSRAQSVDREDPIYIMLKDNKDYTIEETLGEEEYELIHNDEPFKTHYNGSSSNSLGTKVYEKLNSTGPLSKNSVKRERTNESTEYPPLTTVAPTMQYKYYKKEKPKKYIYFNNGTDYTFISYDDFMKEYVEEGTDEEKRGYLSNDNDTSNPALLRTVKSLFTFDLHCKNCTAEELRYIGLKSLCCLALDYQRGESPRVVAARLWRIVKIWTLLYLFIALPLWCMKGWCCCCLCCKFFKPRETIEEAKVYFLMNPPGVLTVNHKEIRYEPSENERDACEEFEHLLRTI